MEKSHGAQYFLRKLLGWHTNPPKNITRSEAERALHGNIDDTGNAQSDPVGLSADPLKRFEMLMSMARSEIAAPIIELYAEESTQPDVSKGKTLWYECNDSTVEKELNEMLERVHVDDYIFSIAAGLAATGNNYQRVLWTPGDGITHMVGTPVNHVTRLWHPTNRKLLGFRWMGEKPNEPTYTNAEDVFAPWDFVHFRRVYSSDTEYGQGLIDHLYPVWKKLSMAIDQMVLYRLHTMPTRYAFSVDVGNADFTDAMEQAHLWKMFMRQQMGMNQQQPGLAGLQSRFDPAAMDSFVIFPKRSAEDKSSIDTLTGDKDVPDIPDIEHLEKQFIGGSRIPKGYLGREEGSGLAQASLVSQDIRFARMVRVLRRPIVAGFYRLAQLHLAYKGQDPFKFKIGVKMSKISSIEEEVNMGTLEKQANLAATIAELCRGLGIPNREIIDLVFREYLSVPRYFLDVAKLSMGVQKALSGQLGGDDGGMGGGMPMGGGGDLGMDMGMPGDMDAGLDDAGLDTPPDDTDLSASKYHKKKPGTLLFERTTKHDAKTLRRALEGIQDGVKKTHKLAESAASTAALKEGLAIIGRATEDVTSIGLTRMVSLVEGITSGDGISASLVEAFAKRTGEKASMDSEAAQTFIPGVSEEMHESVAALKRARKAKAN